MKFKMLFPAVLTDFPNSKVCLIEEWSIDKQNVEWEFSQLSHFHSNKSKDRLESRSESLYENSSILKSWSNDKICIRVEKN